MKGCPRASSAASASPSRAIGLLDLLIGMLPAAVAAPRCAAEYFELLRQLMAPQARRLYLVVKGLLGQLCSLIGDEAQRFGELCPRSRLVFTADHEQRRDVSEGEVIEMGVLEDYAASDQRPQISLKALEAPLKLAHQRVSLSLIYSM